MGFSATLGHQDGWTVLHLQGELDLAEQVTVSSIIDATMDSGARRIILDLAALEFVDTSGMSGIRRSTDRAEQLDVDVVVANATELATLVLKVCGVPHVIKKPMTFAS